MEQRLERTNNDPSYNLHAAGFGQSVVTPTTSGAMVPPAPASPASTKTGKENARVSASVLDAELSNRRKVKALRTRSRARANADDAMDIDEPPSTRLENITNQSLPEDVRQNDYDSDDRVLPVPCPEDDGWTPGTENDDHPLVEASAQPPEVFPTPPFAEDDAPPDDGFWPTKGDIDHMEVFRSSSPPLPWYEENPPKIKKRSAREGEDLRLKVLENNLKIRIHDVEEARAVLLHYMQHLTMGNPEEQELGDTSFSFDDHDHDSDALPDAPMVVEPFQIVVPTAEPLFSSLPSDYDRPGTPAFDAPSGSLVAPAPASEDFNTFLPGFLLNHPPSAFTQNTDPFADLQSPPSGFHDTVTTNDYASSSTAVLPDPPLPSLFDDITTYFGMADTPAPVDPTWALSLLPQPAVHSNYFAPSISLDLQSGKAKAPAVRPTCSRFTTNDIENACWTEYARERLFRRRQRLLRKLGDFAHGIKDLPLDPRPSDAVPVVPMEKRARQKEWRDKFEDYVMIFCGPGTKTPRAASGQ